MDLIKEIHGNIAEKELYERYGIDINEVYGVAPADPLGGETRRERQAGERQWRAGASAQKWSAPVQTDRTPPPPQPGGRASTTSPQMGDTVILPQGGMGKVVKNFMGKITVEGPQGQIVVNAAQMVGPGKGPDGEMTWAVKK